MDDLNISKELLSKSKNLFVQIVKKQLGPSELDKVIVDAHQKFLFDVIEKRKDKDDMQTFMFLCNYKRIVKEYQRCKKVCDLAAEFLSEDARPEDVDEDWINVFFDKVKLISSEQLQFLWCKILAEEMNKPGCISFSLLHAISMMGSTEAYSFCNLARFSFREYKGDSYHPLVFISSDPEAYKDSGITYSVLRTLERLGLIYCNFPNEYIFDKRKRLISGNHVVDVLGDPNNGKRILAGNVIFTEDGKQLHAIVGDEFKRYRQDILDFTLQRLIQRHCTVYLNGKLLPRK